MICVDPLFDTKPYTRPGTPRCFRNTLSCHMFSDLPGEEGTRELVAFARRIGLKPEWIQHRGSHLEHFDLVERRRVAAVAAGAREVDWREGARISLAGRRRSRGWTGEPGGERDGIATDR